jgi:hypothetical protein
MTEDVQMTFSVEQELLDAFTDAAVQQGRTAKEVLCDFMHAYVTCRGSTSVLWLAVRYRMPSVGAVRMP